MPTEPPAGFWEKVQLKTQQRNAEQHAPLVRALGLAHCWLQLLDDAKFQSIMEIAVAEAIDLGRASRILRLAQLSPAITVAALAEHR